MRTGELRTRGTIEIRDDAASNIGGSTEWLTYASGVWAKIEPTSGREFEDAGKTQGEESHILTIRYLRGLKQSMRYAPDGDLRKFRFISIENIKERNRELRIPCTVDGDQYEQ